MDGKDDRIEVELEEDQKSRMFESDEPDARRTATLNIPAGIEKVLYKASIDPGFRTRLLADRAGAVREHGLELTAVESHVLESIPCERLEHIIAHIEPRKHGKREFMKTIATAVVTLATGTAAVSCQKEEMPSWGIAPDAVDDPDLPGEVAEDTLDAPDEISADVPGEDVEEDADEED